MPARKQQEKHPTCCAIYCRVSSRGQANEKTIESQIADCRAFADAQGWKVIETATDDAKSGNVEPWNRSGFRRVLDLIRPATAGPAPRIDVLLAYHEDRISRDVDNIDLPVVLKELRERGIKLATPSRAIVDLDSKEGRLQEGVLGCIASYQRSCIRDNTLRGRKYAVLSGKGHPHTRPPLGYLYDKKSRSVVIDAATAPTVRRLFELLSAGRSTRDTVHTLKREELAGKPKKDGTVVWLEITTARRTAQRPEYHKGTWAPVPKWDPDYVMDCDPLVPREMWQAAQEILKKKRAPKRKTKTFFLLRGLARCSSCGGAMRAHSRNGYDHLSSYRCWRAGATPLNGRKCTKGRTIRRDELDSLVWGRVVELLSHPDALEEAVRQALETQWRSDGDAKAELVTVDKRLREVEQERERVKTMYRKGLIDDREMEDDLGAANVARDDLLIRKQQLKARVKMPKDLADQEAVRELSLALRGDLAHLTPKTRAGIVGDAVDTVHVDSDTGEVRIDFAIPIPDAVRHTDTTPDGLQDGCSPMTTRS